MAALHKQKTGNAGTRLAAEQRCAVVPAAYRWPMNIQNTGGLTAEQAEALFNLANNGVLTRTDERGKRCEDLYQWGLHPHTAETRSALSADDDAFAATYPLTLAGPQAVTEHALFPAMSAAESLHTAGILVARRRSHRQPHIAEVLQLCRVGVGVRGPDYLAAGRPGSRGAPGPVHV
jgi:hypothetical protein